MSSTPLLDAVKPLDSGWLVVDDSPLYSLRGSKGYYSRKTRLELDDDPRHLRVVKFVDAPPEDPALDW